MKKTKVDMNPERLLITNMIVSDRFLREIMPVFRPALLKTEYAREVSTWIQEYWNQYKKAPGKDIQNIYQHKKQNLRDDEEAENIAEFLGRLSSEWEQNQVNNVDFAINSAIVYLKTRSLEILKEQLEGALADGNALQGEQFVANFARIAPPMGEGVDILRDVAKVASAFIGEEETLFQFPGAFGSVAGKFLRGDFVAYLAPMKRGKTWHLWYLAETAAYYGYKVLFVTLEMKWEQMTRRGWQSLVGSPKEDCSLILPYFEEGPDGLWRINYRKEDRKKVDPSSIEEIQKTLRRRFRGGSIKIISFPAYSADINDIEAVIDNLSYYERFVPDVIVIDYADIVAPTRGFRGEYRHQIDDIWKRMRRMAQTRNALVATVSQAEKSSFYTDVTETHVAEDIRKLAHVTCMLGLSQKKEEKEQGIMRVGQIAIREGKSVMDQAVVLYNLDIGRAVLDSRFKHEVDLKDEDEEEEEKTSKKRRRN